MGWNLFLGQSGESHASRYLKRLGYRIIARNHRNQIGELDLIARDGQTWVFVEVKTRSSRESGHPADAVHRTKQRQLVRTALCYLRENRLLSQPARFDIIAVIEAVDSGLVNVEHFPNAFEPDFNGQFFC